MQRDRESRSTNFRSTTPIPGPGSGYKLTRNVEEAPTADHSVDLAASPAAGTTGTGVLKPSKALHAGSGAGYQFRPNGQRF